MLYKPGIEYNFWSFGEVKLPFKWYYRPEDKAALLAAKAFFTENGVKRETNPLVSDSNPLYDAVKVDSSYFNFPASVSVIKDGWGPAMYTVDTTNLITLKEGYSFNYSVNVGAENKAEGWNRCRIYINNDGGVTSYGSAEYCVPLIVIEEKEEVPDFDTEDVTEPEEEVEEDVESPEEPEVLSEGESFAVNKCTYQVTSDEDSIEVQLTKCKASKSVTVPATVTFDGVKYKVTAIKKDAFKKNTKITSVTIGKNVKTIGKQAFAGCAKLKTVKFGSGTKEVGKQAFTGCKSLETVKLGANTQTIGAQAFQGCKKLTKITIPAKVKSIGKQAFQGCKKLKTVTIKSTKLKTVEGKAFADCNKKMTVKVPKSKYSKYKKLLKKAGVKTIKKF